MDNHQKAEFLIEDAETLQEQDLEASVVMLKEALKIAPDYPNLANKVFLRESSLKDLDKTRDKLKEFIKEGKYHTAFEMIKNMPLGYQFKQRAEISKELTDRFNQAEGLVMEAKKLSKGEQLQSWTLLTRAMDIMPDLPGLSEQIQNIEDSTLELKTSLDSIGHSIEQGDTKEAQAYLESLKKLCLLNNDKLNELQHKINKKKRERFIRVHGVIWGGLLAILIIGYASFEYSHLSSATQKWEQVDSLIGDGKYAEVMMSAKLAREELSSVHIFGRSKKANLERRITSLLNSTAFQKAKKGYILFEGKYVAKEAVESAKKLNKNIKDGDELYSQGKYISAIEHYQQALTLVHEVADDDAETLIFDLESNIYEAKLAKLEDILAEAEKLYQAADYKKAIANYNKALKFARVYGISTDQDIIIDKARSAIYKSHLAKLTSMKKKGDKFLANRQYHTAFDLYNTAIIYARKYKITKKEILRELNYSRNIANISRLLADGKKAFATSKWLEAKTKYQQAIDLATSTGLIQTHGLKKASANLKIAKQKANLILAKKMLQEADKSFVKRKYQKSIALYKKIPIFIKENSLHKDPAFATLLSTVQQKINNATELIFASSKQEFLTKNYRPILLKYFKLPRDTTFLNPEIVLLFSDKKTMTFSVSALSYQKKGRQVNQGKYELHYRYDIARKRWQVVNTFMDKKQKQEENISF